MASTAPLKPQHCTLIEAPHVSGVYLLDGQLQVAPANP